MDEAGIDLQVLSHANPGLQKMDAETAVRLARGANDRLHETVRAHPDRFAAFAAIPTPDPKAAADELERTVTRLGFKGAMVNGLTNGVFFDDKRFWPIFERAAALDVPLYMHPSLPHPAVIEAYYKDYVQQYPSLLRAAWGFTVETATQGVRLVLSGVFDAYPNLKIIIGHLGEGLPFYLWRISMGLGRDGKSGKSFRDTFCEHFYITTSGFFSDPALAVLRNGDGHRPDHVFGRLSVRRQPARRQMDRNPAPMRRGPGQALERQRQAAAEAVAGRPRPWPEVAPQGPLPGRRAGWGQPVIAGCGSPPCAECGRYQCPSRFSRRPARR